MVTLSARSNATIFTLALATMSRRASANSAYRGSALASGMKRQKYGLERQHSSG